MKLSSETIEQIVRDTTTELWKSAPVKTGKGRRSLSVIYGFNWIGVVFGLPYMIYQNRGFAPFLMKALAGKTIPMRGPDGKLHFRYVNPKSIGAPGRINQRDHKTGRILPGNVGVQWRHPGLKPKNYAEKSIKTAINKNRTLIAKDVVNNLLRGNK